MSLPLESAFGYSHTLILAGIGYDVYKIIQFTSHIEAVEMELSQLENQLLSEKCWIDTNEQRFSPQEALEAYRRFKSWGNVILAHPAWCPHIEKIERAEYRYPVLMYRGKIIDGMHRILHAITDGVERIPVRILSELPKAALL